MAYSFECGSCHAIYKLDESQITQKGVKITCPKCLNYFILKKGSVTGPTLDAAYIEYVIDDGMQDKTTKRPPPQAPTGFEAGEKTEKIITSDQTEKIHIGPSINAQKTVSKPKRIPSHVKEPVSDDPYPVLKEEKKKRNKALPYLVAIFFIIIVIFLTFKLL